MFTLPTQRLQPLRLLTAGLMVLAFAAPTFAQQPAQSAGPSDTCICRAQGQNWKLGESVCLPTANGPRLAVCDMVLNNTSWRQTDQSCPQATGPVSLRRG